MLLTPLYIHVKKGTSLKPGSLVGEHAVRADYVALPNGDAIGKVLATSARARQILEAEPGITVLPPLHRPIKAAHAKAFSHAHDYGSFAATEGEIGYDVAERLHDFHKMPWLHPEEPFLDYRG